jgi:adenosylcobinamide-GDP ribazoletransferase
MSAAVPWFPAVGVLLGLLQGGLYVGLLEITTPVLAAVLSSAVIAQITGAFHHDGLADMADAFGGGWDTEQRLVIMSDSRLGTYGVTALLFVVVAEIAALSALSGWTAVGATIAAHTISRAVAAFIMVSAPPARDSGLGVDYLEGLSRPAILGMSITVAVLIGTLFGVVAIPMLFAAYAAGSMIVGLAMSKIGGISGDVLGAIQQVSKIAILVVAVIAAELALEPGALTGLTLGR